MAVYDPRGGGNVHIDKVLTNMSMGYQNLDFVGQTLTPVVPVTKQSDKYYEFDREHWRVEPSDTLRAPGSPAIEIPGLTVSVNPYYANEHALKVLVTDEETANADSPLNPRADGTELVTERLHLRKEIAIRDMVVTTANYAAGHSATLSGTAQWSDHTNGASDPIGNFRTARDQIHSQIFKTPNTSIVPWEVMSGLEDHPDFIERIKYSERGVISHEILSALLNMPKMVVPGAGYNSANPGQADAIGYIWGKDVVIAYVPERPAMKTPAFMYEFNWGFSSGSRFLVDRWRDTDRVGEWVRARERYDHRRIAVDGSGNSIAGFIYKAVVA